MQDRPWCRSRFWLCHFLNNRHVRATIDWSVPLHAQPALRRELARALHGVSAALGADRRWLIERAERNCGSDPAYVQCLRLFAKEERYLTSLVHRLGDDEKAGEQRPSWAARLTSPLHRVLGLRFELSVLLLAEMVDLTFCSLAGDASDDATVHQIRRQLAADRRAHVAFHAERLTQEFADFNFIRRNLRRWRLRLLFAGLLGWGVLRHGGLIRTAGWTRLRLVAAAWADFSEVLERMVPYHREALLAALLQQRDRPYDKPTPGI